MSVLTNGKKSAYFLGISDIQKMQETYGSLVEAAEATGYDYLSLRRRSIAMGLPWPNANRAAQLEDIQNLLNEGLNANQIAKKLGVNRSTITRNIENYDLRPKKD